MTDTVRIRVLPESMFQERASSAAPPPSFDPYSTDIGAQAVRERPRRGLDDMRRLSEQIKRIRAGSAYEPWRARKAAEAPREDSSVTTEPFS